MVGEEGDGPVSRIRMARKPRRTSTCAADTVDRAAESKTFKFLHTALSTNPTDLESTSIIRDLRPPAIVDKSWLGCGFLVMSLPQGTTTTTTATTADLSGNSNIVDLSQRLQGVLDAVNAGDSMRVYTLSSSLLQYDIRMSSSDGTAVTTETDMLSSMNEFLAGVAYHTFDLPTVRYHSLQALDLMQQSGYRYYVDTSTTTTTTTTAYEYTQVN
ncbi:hypothetical protein PGTUg99_015356 [Puccinia graminis f. sp. tritici]|uniref:Uncharacterized protein n=1 Tax=Puccinia graminis f. sp. tritici TaxID=56615 RepID=A0A5B0SKV3_PUCGR|nr:hypothetical protein PGTUg99_015356 [Puccinia graminis f. sp. tritici]